MCGVGHRFNGGSGCRETRAAMESGLCGVVGLRFNGGSRCRESRDAMESGPCRVGFKC